MGTAEEVFAQYALRGEFTVEDVRSYLVAGGDMAGYLFRCARCGKYKIGRCKLNLRLNLKNFTRPDQHLENVKFELAKFDAVLLLC